MKTQHHVIILIVLAGLLFFLDLGRLGLTDQDEGLNAEAAREMVERGDWVSPTFNDEPRLKKPVLLYWLVGSSYKLFGVNEFSARLPSAIFGLALIFLQYGFLRRIRGSTVAFLASLILLLNFEIVPIGRMVITDSLLVFCTTLSLFSFWLGLRGVGRERHFFWLFYLGMAMGTLTKGPVGFGLPLLVLVPYLTWAKRWKEFWIKGFPIFGVLFYLILTLPWFAAMISRHGAAYWGSIQAENVGRFLQTREGHGGTPFFYIPVLLFGFFPWSLFLPVAWIQGFKRSKNELEFFAALWVIVIFLFFSASATRLPHYIAPLFPAAAILVADYLSQARQEMRLPGLRSSLISMVIVGFLMGGSLFALPLLWPVIAGRFSTELPSLVAFQIGWGPMVVAIVILLGTCLAGFWGWIKRFRNWAFGTACAMILLIHLLVIKFILPQINQVFISPAQTLAKTGGELLGKKGEFIFYGPIRPSLVFYANRRAMIVGEGQEEKITSLLNTSEPLLILLPLQLQTRLPLEARNLAVLDRKENFILLGKNAGEIPYQP